MAARLHMCCQAAGNQDDIAKSARMSTLHSGMDAACTSCQICCICHSKQHCWIIRSSSLERTIQQQYQVADAANLAAATRVQWQQGLRGYLT